MKRKLLVIICSLFLLVGHEARAENLECSLTCLELIANQGKLSKNNLASDLTKYQSEIEKRYKRLRVRVSNHSNFKGIMEFMTLDMPGTIVKAVVSEAPFVGSIAADAIDGSQSLIKEKMAKNYQKIIRKSLVLIEKDQNLSQEFDLAISPQTRFEVVNNALVKLKALNSDENLFDSIQDPKLRDEIQQSSIRMLIGSVKTLTMQVKKNHSDITNIASSLKRNSKIVSKLEKEMDKLRIQAKTLRVKAEKAKNRTNDDLKDTKNIGYRPSEFIKDVENTGKQLAVTSEILNELGAPEAARAVGFASGAVNLALGIATCSVDPLAILPTVLGGIKFFKSFGGAKKKRTDPSLKYLKIILKLQKKILSKLDILEKNISDNHLKTMRALVTVNENVLLMYDSLRTQQTQDFNHCYGLRRKDTFYPSSHPERSNYLRFGQTPNFEDLKSFRVHASSLQQDSINNCLQILHRHFTAVGESGAKISPVFRTNLSKRISEKGDPVAVDPIANLSEHAIALARQLSGDTRLLSLRFDQRTIDQIMGSISQTDKQLAEGITSKYAREYFPNLFTSLNPIAVSRYVSILLGTHFYYELAPNGVVLRPERELSSVVNSIEARNVMAWAHVILDIAIAQENLKVGAGLLPLLYTVTFRTCEKNKINVDIIPGIDKILNKEACKKLHAYQSIFNDRLLGKELQLLSQKSNLRKNWEISLDKWPVVFRTTPEKRQKGRLMHTFARNNPLFARNFAHFIVDRRLKVTGNSATAYRLAFDSIRAPNLLKKVLGRLPMQIVWSEKNAPNSGARRGWNFLINGTHLPLPSPDQLDSGQLLLTPEYQHLLWLRSLVVRENLSYQLANIDSLSTGDVQDLKFLMSAGIDPIGLTPANFSMYK